MNNKEKDVLHLLCNGDITFSEASGMLGVSKEEVEEMLDHFNWIPSSDRIVELCEVEKETLSYIKDISQPISLRLSHEEGIKTSYEPMCYTGQIDAQIQSIEPISNILQDQESVVINHTESNGVPYIQ